MSSVGLALSRTASISQEFAQKPSPSSNPTLPYRNAAIGGSAPNSLPSQIPEDKVTISNTLSFSKPPQNQSTNGVLGGANSAAPVASRPAAGQYDLLNAKQNSNPIAVNSAQVGADGTPKSSNTTGGQPSSVNAQEQLQELDRTLQQLGINPESVSLIRRVELLVLANNPAALQQYFQSSPSNAAQNSQLSPNTANPATPSETTVPAANSPNPPPAMSPSESTVTGNHLNVSA
jgi:hypothetical protein